MDMDGQKAIQWNGLSAHVDLKRHTNVTGRLFKDVAQGYSNIDADSQMYLYEAWMLQSLSHDRIQVQLGQIDANTKFATVVAAADYLNSSMGYSPTIVSFPTYPNPKPGFDISVNVPAGCRLVAGGFQTDLGKMAVAELDKKWTSGSGRAGEVEFGSWHLRGPLTTRAGGHVSATHGYYAVVEQSLWNSKNSGESGRARKLTAFLQLGSGGAHLNNITSHVGFGSVLQAPFSRRPGDSIGMAATRARTAGHSNEYASANPEFVSEAYYKLAMKGGVALVEDMQYFVNPGARLHRPSFFVLTQRLVFTF